MLLYNHRKEQKQKVEIKHITSNHTTTKGDNTMMTAFVGAIEREDTITIDGYSNANSLRGVMNDISRVMAKYEPNEIDTFAVSSNKEAEELLNCTPELSCGGFFVTVEDVPCAST